MSSFYKVWLMNYRPAWYALGKSAQDELMGKVGESLNKVGGRVLLIAASLWADEKWAAWGVEEYPNIEAVIQHAQTIGDFNWFRYTKSWTTLGISWEPDAKVVVPEAPVYRVAFFKVSEDGYRLSKEDNDRWNKKHEGLYKEFGAQNILGCNAFWCTEEWPLWVVEAYPSLEAVQGFRSKVYEAGWYRYVTATSLLGVKYPMG